MQHSISQSEQTLDVYLQLFTLQRRTDSISFVSQINYTSEQHSDYFPAFDTIQSTDHLLIIHFSVPDTLKNILILRYQDQRSFFFPIQLKFTNVQYPEFLIFEEGATAPVFNTYLNQGKYLIRSEEAVPDATVIFRYKELFKAADPPMALGSDLSPALEIETKLISTNKGLSFESGFFYFMQKDSATNIGLTRYVGGKYFPKYTQLNEITLPIMYLARKSEFQKIQTSSNKKKAFDAFWLNLYPIKRNASDAIASYFQRVTQANQMFTNYKPGWKTDRGMIYIVMGPPEVVERYDWREVWKYDETVEFEFRIISNLFAPQQYYLTREQSLADVWYENVKALRNNK